MNPFRLYVRIVQRGTVVWTAIPAIIVASGIATYNGIYPTHASRVQLMSQLGNNRAFAALEGQAVYINTPGGFVVWKYSAILTTLVALWALLSVSKLLRGDEERGRTDLLVAGPVSITTQLAVQLGVMAAAVSVVGVAVASAAVATGLPVGGSALLGFTVASGGWVFGALAAVSSQLLATRRKASGLAGAILGTSLLIRAVATGSGRYWLCWLTPLGWAERLSPFSDPRYISLVLILVSSLVLGAAALWLRGRRDTGEGTVTVRDRPTAHVRPLRSVHGLDWRLNRGNALAWGVGSVVTGFVMGFIASGLVDYTRQNESVGKLITRYTNNSASSTAGFLGLAFSIVAIVLAIFAGTVMARAREEEGCGHADAMFCAGASRWRFVASRAVQGVVVVVLAVLASCAAWAGTAVSGKAADFGSALKGGLNTVPLVLLFGGIALLVFGVVPRATSVMRFASVGLAYAIVFIGGAIKAPQWFLNVSPFTHLAPVPAAAADPEALIVMLCLAVLTGLAGAAAFAHRDTQVE